MSWSALRLSLTVTGRMHVKSDELSESRTTAHPSLPVLLRRSLFPSTSRVLNVCFSCSWSRPVTLFTLNSTEGRETGGRRRSVCVCTSVQMRFCNPRAEMSGVPFPHSVHSPCMSVHSGLHVYEHDKPPPYSPIYTIIYTENTCSSHKVSQFDTIDLIHAADWKHPKLVYCIFQSCLIHFFHYKSPPCMCDVSISRCSLSD